MHKRKLRLQQNIQEGRFVGLIPRIPDIIDSNPDREQRISAGPRGGGGLRSDSIKELVDLVSERQNGRLIRRYESRVDSRSSVGVVVR